MKILKEQIYSQKRVEGSKFKEIIEEMKCEILKAFYKRAGVITLTSHEIIFFDEV